MKPTISVITICYNAEKEIESTMISVLEQSFKDIEYIIVDDGSQDDTLAIATALAANDNRIKVISSHRIGRVAALNLAVTSATCEYIANLDIDDIAHPTRLNSLTLIKASLPLPQAGGAL